MSLICAVSPILTLALGETVNFSTKAETSVPYGTVIAIALLVSSITAVATGLVKANVSIDLPESSNGSDFLFTILSISEAVLNGTYLRQYPSINQCFRYNITKSNKAF